MTPQTHCSLHSSPPLFSSSSWQGAPLPAASLPWPPPHGQADCTCNNWRTLTECPLQNLGRPDIPDRPFFSAEEHRKGTGLDGDAPQERQRTQAPRGLTSKKSSGQENALEAVLATYLPTYPLLKPLEKSQRGREAWAKPEQSITQGINCWDVQSTENHRTQPGWSSSGEKRTWSRPSRQPAAAAPDLQPRTQTGNGRRLGPLGVSHRDSKAALRVCVCVDGNQTFPCRPLRAGHCGGGTFCLPSWAEATWGRLWKVLWDKSHEGSTLLPTPCSSTGWITVTRPRWGCP